MSKHDQSDSTPPSDPICRQVREALPELLAGSAAEELYEHLAECDACRDARYDAERARELALDSAADYVHPPDLAERLLAALPAGGGGTDAPHSREVERQAALQAEDTAAEAGREEAVTDAPATAGSGSALPLTQPSPETDAAAAVTERAPAVRQSSRGKVISLGRRLRRPRNTVALGLLGAALAAAAVSLLVSTDDGGPLGPGGPVAAAEPWQGEVVKISRAAGGAGGLKVCKSDGSACSEATGGSKVPPGALLETDDRTRAYLELTDGSRLALDRSTKLSLRADADRRAKLGQGALVADVAQIEDSKARFDLPRGYAEVLGTKLALRSSGDATAVDVSRGAVRLVDEQSREVTVQAGEEGHSYRGLAPYATAAPTLGEALSWSEAQSEADGAAAARGLGELVAKKPGTDEEKVGAVKLTTHKVKTRIVDNFARTEVEEVFSNTTGEVLEGIYRFPLPPDAQIERLALEVDDHLEEGAFVDREQAAKIWRGAIVNAAPKRQVREEIIWVPGPWKDPALLEWQRGGRFELRIFPIPKQGSRRVILTYTQVIEPTGGVRRYVYPLPYDPSGSATVDKFDLDVQVKGHDPAFGVRTYGGYGIDQSGERLTLSRQSFVPSGDLVVEYALPSRDSELQAWSYQLSAADIAKAKDAKQAAGSPPAADQAAGAGPADTAPYVALALRPKLPRWTEDAHRSYALVVDSSRSMMGERYRRASALAVRVVQELDRLDSFTVLACDTSCRVLDGGLRAPGNQAAKDVQRFLEGITPEGGSDVAAAIRQAAAAAGADASRALRLVYLGDGTPTVGPIRPRYLTQAVQEAVPAGRGTVTAVAVGADADTDSLGALARGGGGVVMPYVPGERPIEAAYAILGATYGRGLRDVKLELPEGLVEQAPARLDTIIAGGETVVAARLTKPHVKGVVKLLGKVGDQAFEQLYQVDIKAASEAGNAFVPRLYTALRIADLERDGSAEARKQAVDLSGRFNVASRYTSLLVLESPAMFKAFGLDNTRRAPVWTGEEETKSSSAKGEVDYEPRDEAERAQPYGGGGYGEGKKAKARAPRAKAAPQAEWGGDSFDDDAPAEPAPPPPPMATATSMPPAKSPAASRPWRRRNMIPMRRVWERKGNIVTSRLVPLKASTDKLAEARQALSANENRRDAVKELYILQTLAGEVDQAAATAQRWADKDALDPAALTARADVAARDGNRDLAIRILGSVVDVRPDDIASQKRLARLHRWAGNEALGCRHSIAISQLRPDDPKLLAEALHCAQRTGQQAMALDMQARAADQVKRRADALLKQLEAKKDRLVGDLRVLATWEGGQHDLDLALLHPDGHRVSWLGAPTTELISAEHVTSKSQEGLGLLGSKGGEYVIEIVRSAGGPGPVKGQLVVHAADAVRTIPFVLEGERATLGLIHVTWQQRLVRAW